MKERLLQQYVNRLTIDDVKNFAYQNGIDLTDEELKWIYDKVIAEWHTIAFGNPRSILDELKAKVSLNSYQKIENLYIHFRNRYL